MLLSLRLSVCLPQLWPRGVGWRRRDLNYKHSVTISCLEVAIVVGTLAPLTTQKLLGGAHQCKLEISEQRRDRQSRVRST